MEAHGSTKLSDVDISDIPTRRTFLGIAGAAIATGGLLQDKTTNAEDLPPVSQPTSKKSGLEHPHALRPTCVTAVDRKHAVSCDDNGGVYLWNINNGKVKYVTTVVVPPPAPVPPGPHIKTKASFVAVTTVTALQYVLTSLYNGNVLVSTIANPFPNPFPDPMPVPLGFDGHARTTAGVEVWTVDAIVIGGTAYAISGDNSGMVIFWDVKARNIISTRQVSDDPVAALLFIPNGDPAKPQFLAGCGDGKMYQFTIDMVTKSIGAVPDKTFDHGNASTVNSIALYSVDLVKFAITASFDSLLRVWDLSKPDNPAPPDPFPKKHRHFVWRVAALPDGSKLASVGEDHAAHFFKKDGSELPVREAGKELSRDPIKTYKKGVMGVVFLDDANAVITTDQIFNPSKPDVNHEIAWIGV